MFSRRNRLVDAFYLLGDALVALISFWLAYLVRARLESLPELYPLANYPWLVPLAVAVWLVAGLLVGTYRDVKEEELQRALADPLKLTLAGTTLLFAIIFALKLYYISRLLVGLFAVINFLLMVLFRLLVRRLAGKIRQGFGGFRYFLIVGGTPEAYEIAGILDGSEKLGLKLFGFVTLDAGAAPDQRGLSRNYPVHALSELPQLLSRHVIDEVIFAVSKDKLERLEETFLMCEEEGVKTRVLLSFFPHVISKVYLEQLREIPLLTFSTTPENESLLLVKRVMDFVMALVLLVLLSPLFLLLSVLLRLTSRGPIIFAQTRCGLGGRRFTLYKFRSMREGADQMREVLAELNEADGPAFKIRNDPRCTPLGRFMRKFSLDELPQLWNVLKGDMSFVGPRPPLPEEVEKYERWQRRRLRMKPGLTCLWALEGRSQLNFQRWMELDLQYIDNWSPALDWKILFKTIPVVLLGRGAS